MAALAIITTAAIAVASWLVTQHQARRATRRNMRIDYLLEAYRRLDRASNRELPQESARDLEAAISDIILLGTPRQAQLAAHFARDFAARHTADSQPLLHDLRQTLRAELLLEPAPAGSYVSLRLDLDDDRVSKHSRIWRETAHNTRQAITTELAEAEAGEAIQLAAAGRPAKPQARVTASARQVEQDLKALLADATNDDLTTLTLGQLTSCATQLSLIDANITQSLDGLAVMHQLALTRPGGTTPAQAAEFTSLATAIRYLLRIATRATNGTAPSPQ